MSCLKTNSGQRITDGTIVILLRYPGIKWIVRDRWYTYRNQQYNGWHLVSIPANMIMPLNESDLELLTIVSGGEMSPPPPEVDVPYMPPEYNYPEHHYHPPKPHPEPPRPLKPEPKPEPESKPDDKPKPEPPKPSEDHPHDDHQSNEDREHEFDHDHDNEEFSKGDDIMAENTTCTKPNNYFVTVRNVEERNRIGREGVIQGKVVKVNCVKGETKYYTYDNESEQWVEETFGLGDEISALQTAVAQLKSVVSTMNTSLKTITEKVEELEEDSETSDEAITELKETIDTLQEKIESIETSEVTWVDASGQEIDD